MPKRPTSKKPPSKRGNSRTSNFSSSVVIGLSFLFVLIYMGRAAHAFFTPGVSTEVVRLGTVEAQRTITGIIIRDEEVFYADRAGTLRFHIDDFDRVRPGAHIASIQDSDAIGDIDDDMHYLENLIMSLQDMRHSTIVAPQVERANANLRNMVNNNIHNFTTGNLAEIQNLHERLSDVSARRNRLIISENRDVRSDWGRAHDQLETRRRMNSSDMYATRSGIMSPIIDGKEDIFTLENKRDLTREQLRFTIDHSTIVPGREIAEGEPAFKIVGNNWYIAALIPNDMAQGWEEGDERTIFVFNEATSNYDPMRMRLVHIESGARDQIVILRSTRNATDFLSQRNISIRTTDLVSRGLTIPASAVTTRSYYRLPRTHISGIDDYYLQHRTDYAIRLIPINISSRTDTHVMIPAESINLSFGDILAPTSLLGEYHELTESDIALVHGVYLANLGIAEFRQINLDMELSELDGLVLLDANRNPGIRQFDTIVTDASTVTQGQIVR